MTTMFPDLDFEFGIIAPIDACYDPSKPLESQLGILREDMFQVSYISGHTIDIGWYPSFEASGKFRVFLVHNNDWEHPLEDIKVQTYPDLVENVRRLVEMVRNRSKYG